LPLEEYIDNLMHNPPKGSNIKKLSCRRETALWTFLNVLLFWF